MTLVGTSQPRNVSPRLSKPFIGEPLTHRGIKASADISPTATGKIVNNHLGQLSGLWKWSGSHDLTGSRINRLSITLKRRLTRYAENLADLLPCSTCPSRFVDRRANQRLCMLPNVVRFAYQLKRIALFTQNWRSQDLPELAVQLLTHRRER